MSELIEYLDRERLKVGFSTLIIKVSSINEYFGQLSEFIEETRLYGVTNGKIHLMAEMMDPPYGLYELIDRHLIPLGLEENKDYALVTERLFTGKKNPLTDLPIPELEHVDWLDSIISPEGYFVWYKEQSLNQQVKQSTSVERN